MYTGDHIVLSTGLGLVLARRLRLAAVPLITALIAVNLIDLDHLVYYSLDDGTANSLTLHPLHIYGGALAFLLLLLPVISRVRVAVAYALAAGLTLHLASDALAYALDYDVLTLAALGIVILGAFTLLARTIVVPGRVAPVVAFAIFAWLLCYAAQGTVHFGLRIDPQASLVPWIVTQVCTLVIIAAFWMVFRRMVGPLVAPPPVPAGATSPPAPEIPH